MVIKFNNFNGNKEIYSLAKDVEHKKYYLDKNLNVLFLQNKVITLLPENNQFVLESEEDNKINECNNGDVFEIEQNGNTFLYYSSESMDNAIFITGKCNSNCIMCPTAEIIRRKAENVRIDHLLEIAKHIPEDAVHITITGGEPFLLHKDIFKLLAYLKMNKNYIKYLLLTNGRAFANAEYCEMFMKNAPKNIILGIPLHGFDSESHDMITQAKGSFEQSFRGLKNLIKLNARIELRFVVSKMNYMHMNQMFDLVIKEFKNIYCLKIMGLEMLGNAAKNQKEVWINYREAFNSAKSGIDLAIYSGINVGLYNFPLCAIDKKYWPIYARSITDYKIRYAEQCEKCIERKACGGIFAGTIRLAGEDAKPFRDDK